MFIFLFWPIHDTFSTLTKNTLKIFTSKINFILVVLYYKFLTKIGITFFLYMIFFHKYISMFSIKRFISTRSFKILASKF